MRKLRLGGGGYKMLGIVREALLGPSLSFSQGMVSNGLFHLVRRQRGTRCRIDRETRQRSWKSSSGKLLMLSL